MEGPGRYLPDATEGIRCVQDLPPPRIQHVKRHPQRCPCPGCGKPAPRRRGCTRRLHDLGDLRSGRPVDLVVGYSQHYCPRCRRWFNVDMDDLALPRCHYTHRVVSLAVRLVVEDGLGYRPASWHIWRDHRVFVPFGTIQNWVEAAGKKS
jgi:hypothetical protein